MPEQPVIPRNNEEHSLTMENNETQQDVLSRATSLPLISSAYKTAALVYASTKENHPYVKVVLDLAEKGVKHVSEMAANGAQPFMNKLEPQVSVVSHYASTFLDKLVEKLPFLQQTADQVISEAQEVVSSKVVDAKEAVAKVVQDGKEMIIDTRMGKLAKTGVDVVLEKSEELLNHYLPMTDEELAKIAESTPEEIHTTYESQGYFAQLGSLSTKFQHRAYQYAVVKVKAAREHIQNTFNQLCQATGQNIQSKISTRNHRKKRKSFNRESHILAMSHPKLWTAYKNWIGNIQGLPGIFQQNIELALHSIELQATFTGARSFKDLSSSLLSQSKKTAGRAQKYVDDTLDYVLQNTPLSWLVGPFVPALKETSCSLEPAKANERKGETLKPEAPAETQ